MSRTDDYAWTDSHSDDDRPDSGLSILDRVAELPSRLGLSREAAHREMERFRGVAEYEIRKIFGQRSTLQLPLESETPRKPKRKSTHSTPSVSRRTISRQASSERRPSEPTVIRNPESAVSVDAPDTQPAPMQPVAEGHLSDPEVTPRD